MHKYHTSYLLFLFYFIILNCTTTTYLRATMTAEALSHLVDYVIEHVSQFSSFAINQTDMRPPWQTWLKSIKRRNRFINKTAGLLMFEYTNQ